MTPHKNHAGAGFVFTLTDAVVDAARILELDLTTLAAILQIDVEFAALLCSGGATLAPARQEEWQRAMDFVRLYCMLEAMNTHHDSGRQWLRQPHAHLRERPIDALLRIDGLHRVLNCIRPTQQPDSDAIQPNAYPYSTKSAQP
ncbi:MAG TPA: antitoxin Xre/MbcA/ParS toxin-binding domain-containing protein [Noviherbaspirillum sp.]|nr:antitoxin Xre/MbcA/ParS toxin-binding domain-containing protein [Noviherbaspirillum sp.]